MGQGEEERERENETEPSVYENLLSEKMVLEIRGNRWFINSTEKMFLYGKRIKLFSYFILFKI